MDLNPIIFWNYYDVELRKHVWLTTTTLNKKIYFCRQPECNEVAYLGLNHLCIECYNRSAYPRDDRDVESCEACGCTAEFRDGDRVCWCDSCQQTGCQYEHHCSGESEYRPEERLCDDRDDPRCPQHRPRRNSIVSPRAYADDEDDWRERTGRCCQCDYFFDLICSSDRKDLCYKCK